MLFIYHIYICLYIMSYFYHIYIEYHIHLLFLTRNLHTFWPKRTEKKRDQLLGSDPSLPSRRACCRSVANQKERHRRGVVGYKGGPTYGGCTLAKTVKSWDRKLVKVPMKNVGSKGRKILEMWILDFIRLYEPLFV